MTLKRASGRERAKTKAHGYILPTSSSLCPRAPSLSQMETPAEAAAKLAHFQMISLFDRNEVCTRCWKYSILPALSLCTYTFGRKVDSGYVFYFHGPSCLHLVANISPCETEWETAQWMSSQTRTSHGKNGWNCVWRYSTELFLHQNDTVNLLHFIWHLLLCTYAILERK